jgi:hypothetical protein
MKINRSKKSIPKYNVPILLITFKRCDFLPNILDEIIKINPAKLYIFQDGPRNKDDLKDVLKVRSLLSKYFEKTDIEIHKNFKEKNIGVALGEPKAIDWVLMKEKYVIVVQDDVLIKNDFFVFMKNVLTKYENEDRILAVNSVNFYHDNYKNLKESFYLSRFFVPWGWAVWRRSWRLFDFYIRDYPFIKKNKEYKSRFLNYKHRFYLESFLEAIYKNKFNTTWDLQFEYLAYKYNKFFVSPRQNLAKNLGQNFGGSNPFLWKDEAKLQKIGKFIFPNKLIYNEKYDEIYFQNRLRGGWFRLLGIYIYNNLLSENQRKLLVKFISFWIKTFKR